MAYNAQIHAEQDISIAMTSLTIPYLKYLWKNILKNTVADFKVCLPTLRENTTLKFSFNFWIFISLC